MSSSSSSRLPLSSHRLSSFLSKFEIDEQDVIINHEIAKGGCGHVFAGSFHETPVAIKVLFQTQNLSDFKKELQTWCCFRHPNILQLLGFAVTARGPAIVMELMDTTLYHVLYKPAPPPGDPLKLSFAQVFRVMMGTASGLSYIHAQRAVHRDIKSLNILLRGGLHHHSLQFDVKIADFGATRGTATLEDGTKDVKTHRWAAPELYQPHGQPTFASDVYALGMVFYEILTQQLPFHSLKTEMQLVKALSDHLRPEILPAALLGLDERAYLPLVALIRDCWQEDPALRPTAKSVLATLKPLKPPPATPSQFADWEIDYFGHTFSQLIQTSALTGPGAAATTSLTLSDPMVRDHLKPRHDEGVHLSASMSTPTPGHFPLHDFLEFSNWDAGTEPETAPLAAKEAVPVAPSATGPSSEPPQLGAVAGFSLPQMELMVCLACSYAVYHSSPLQWLQEFRSFPLPPVRQCTELVDLGDPFPAFFMATFAWEGKNILVVAVRGSEKAEDWMYNLNVVGSVDNMAGRTHQGFSRRAAMFPLNLLTDLLLKDPHVLIRLTGHSQGSAVAELILIRLLKSHRIVPSDFQRLKFVGFASPLVADIHAQSIWNSPTYAALFHRIVNKRDIVPRLLMLSGIELLRATLQSLIQSLIDILFNPFNLGRRSVLMGKVADLLKSAVSHSLTTLLPKYTSSVGYWNFVEQSLHLDGLHHQLTVHHWYGRQAHQLFDSLNILDFLPSADDFTPFQDHMILSYLHSCQQICSELPVASLAASDSPHFPSAPISIHSLCQVDIITSATFRVFFSELIVEVKAPFLQYALTSVQLSSRGKIHDGQFTQRSDNTLFLKVDRVTPSSFPANRLIQLTLDVVTQQRFNLLISVKFDTTELPLWMAMQASWFMSLISQDAEEVRHTLIHLDQVLASRTAGQGIKFDRCVRALAVLHLLVQPAFLKSTFDDMAASTSFDDYYSSTTKLVRQITTGVLGHTPKRYLYDLLSHPECLPPLVDLDTFYRHLTAAQHRFDRAADSSSIAGPSEAAGQSPQFDIEFVDPKQKHNLSFEGIKTFFSQECFIDPTGRPDVCYLYLKGMPELFLLTLLQHRLCFKAVRSPPKGWYEKFLRLFSSSHENLLAQKSYADKLLSFALTFALDVDNINLSLEELEEKIVQLDIPKDFVSAASAYEQLKTFTQEDFNDLLRFKISVGLIVDLRLHLNRQYLMVIGTQKSGKSSLVERLWDINVGTAGSLEHTRQPRAYSFPKRTRINPRRLQVIDFPAFDDKSGIRNEIQRHVLPFGHAALICLDLSHCNNQMSFKILDFVQQLDIPSLVLLHRADELCRVILSDLGYDFVSSTSDTKRRTKPKAQKSAPRLSVADCYQRFLKKANENRFEIESKFPGFQGRVFFAATHFDRLQDLTIFMLQHGQDLTSIISAFDVIQPLYWNQEDIPSLRAHVPSFPLDDLQIADAKNLDSSLLIAPNVIYGETGVLALIRKFFPRQGDWDLITRYQADSDSYQPPIDHVPFVCQLCKTLESTPLLWPSPPSTSVEQPTAVSTQWPGNRIPYSVFSEFCESKLIPRLFPVDLECNEVSRWHRVLSTYPVHLILKNNLLMYWARDGLDPLALSKESPPSPKNIIFLPGAQVEQWEKTLDIGITSITSSQPVSPSRCIFRFTHRHHWRTWCDIIRQHVN